MNKILAKLLPVILTVVSPEIKKAIQEFASKLAVDAKKTPNPWDDVLAAILQSIVGSD